MWVLGVAFMRGWYNIHDYERQSFGFVPYKGSGKTLPWLETVMPTTALPEQYVSGHQDWMRDEARRQVFLLSLLVTVLTCLVIVLLILLIRSRKTTFAPVPTPLSWRGLGRRGRFCSEGEAADAAVQIVTLL